MSKDSVDTLKAVLFLILIFAGAALVGLFVLDGWYAYGKGLPFIGTLPGYRPPNTVQMLSFARPLSVVSGCWLIAVGGALLLRSAYIDHMLQIFAKALSMIAGAYLGIIAGHWAYLRMTRAGDVDPDGLTRIGIIFAAATLVAMLLRIETLRGRSWLRFVLAAALILFAPLLLVTGP